MNTSPRLLLVSILASQVVGFAVNAQDTSVGAEIFVDRCVVCHGEGGGGDGPVGELFAQRPENLRLLAQENGGVYPMQQVVEAIDGRRDIPAHGRTQMPIWGEYFMVQALEDRDINPKDAADIVQGRVLSVAYYLQSLQVD